MNWTIAIGLAVVGAGVLAWRHYHPSRRSRLDDMLKGEADGRQFAAQDIATGSDKPSWSEKQLRERETLGATSNGQNPYDEGWAIGYREEWAEKWAKKGKYK